MDIHEATNKSRVGGFWEFLSKRKVWWIVPIIVVILIVACTIVVLQSGYVSPLIYAL